MKNHKNAKSPRLALGAEILIARGGAIKSISLEGNTAKVGGLLVRFSNPDDADWYGDYFDSATDFKLTEGMKVPIYFDHGDNGVLGIKVLGYGVLSLTAEGVAIEGEIDVSDPNVRAVYDQVVASEMGWSSGTAGYLVTRTQVRSYAIHGESVYHIDHWPLGLDASLTPWPADASNVAEAKNRKSRGITFLKARGGSVCDIPLENEDEEPEEIDAEETEEQEEEEQESDLIEIIKIQAQALCL